MNRLLRLGRRSAAVLLLTSGAALASAAPASAGLDYCGHGVNKHKHHVGQFYYTEYWHSAARGYYDKYLSPGYSHHHSYAYYWFATNRRGASGNTTRGCSRSGYGPHSRSRSVADLTGGPDADMEASILVGSTPLGNENENTVPVDASAAPGGDLPDADPSPSVSADPVATADGAVGNPDPDNHRARCIREALLYGTETRTCFQ